VKHMSVKSIDEILNAVKERVGDDTSDSAISFVEDISDTLNSLSEQENWKQKYEQNDREWRKKYRDRFLSGESSSDDDDSGDENEPLTYEKLFNVEG
jgi:hypothetical protein